MSRIVTECPKASRHWEQGMDDEGQQDTPDYTGIAGLRWFWLNSRLDGKPCSQCGVLNVGIEPASSEHKAVATGNE